VYVADAAGEAMGASWKTAMLAVFNDYRLVNTIITISDPTYTTITVTYTVKAYPGFDPVDLKDRINAELANYLGPANWGKPTYGDPSSAPGWVNDTVVRQFKLVDLIGNVMGVDYVSSLSISGSAGSASGSNWQMPGTVALPRSGAHVGTIT
jgi:hypothetical protein